MASKGRRGKARKLLLWILCISASAFSERGGRPAQAQGLPEARAALRAGEYAAARQGFEAALRARPDLEEAQVGLLQALRETGAYQEACKRADEFVKLRSSAGLHLERARSARAVGDYPGAEEHLRLALASPALRRTVQAELADLLDSLGRTADADALWEGLLNDYRANRISAPRDMGIIALAAWQRGYIEDAKDFFIDATGSQPGPDTPLEILSNFGYLFLEKYRPTEALGVFRDCLKINKAYPPALVGIALAKLYESNDEAGNYARAALQVNPNFAPALNLMAQLSIQEELYPEALRQIRRALEVNPRDLEALSLEAVYHQIREDAGEFAAVEKKILAINPAYGRLYHTLAENLVIRRKYGEAVDFYRKAVALDPRLFSAYVGMGMNLMRLGDLKEGRAMVQRAFEGDSYNVWAFNTLDLLDQMDKFRTVRSEHFILKMAPEDEPVLPPYATALAEEAYSKLTARYGFTPEGPLQIELFPDKGGFAVRTLGLPDLGALGVCFGKVVALNSPRARKAGEFNWGTTLWHEFMHVVSLQMTRHNIPRWFSEALSVYEEQRARPGWGDDLTAIFIKAYKEGKLLKVSELNTGMMRPNFPEQIALSYYQAGLFCNMIEEKFGFEKIRQSLLLFARNRSAEDVFRETLGWDMKTLDEQYNAYLDGRLRAIASHLDFQFLATQAKAGDPSDDATLAALAKKNPEEFFVNLQLGSRLYEDKSYAQAEAYLKKAQSLFPSFIEPGNPYEMLSAMYLEMGREEDALTQLNAWSRHDENSLAALRAAAEIYRKRKEWANATRCLELSVFIDPYDTRMHTLLGESAMAAENWTAAIAAFQVLVGLNPPDPAGAHCNLALALYGAGRKAEARREILRSLEIAPTFEKAQQLLLKLNERKVARKPQDGGVQVGPGRRPGPMSAARLGNAEDIRPWEQQGGFVPHRLRRGGALVQGFINTVMYSATGAEWSRLRSFTGWKPVPR